MHKQSSRSEWANKPTKEEGKKKKNKQKEEKKKKEKKPGRDEGKHEKEKRAKSDGVHGINAASVWTRLQLSGWP